MTKKEYETSIEYFLKAILYGNKESHKLLTHIFKKYKDIITNLEEENKKLKIELEGGSGYKQCEKEFEINKAIINPTS